MDIISIQKKISQIDKLEAENKTSKDLIKSELDNDEVYVDAKQKAKDANSTKKKIKDEILSRESNQEVLAKIKENQEEITTLKEILSLELVELYQKEKTDFVEDSSGEQRKFKLEVKLLPKKFREQNNNPGDFIEIPLK